MRAAASLAVAAFALACAPGAGAAATPLVKQNGPLSPLLKRLANPAVRSAGHAAQARALGIARSGPGSLVRRDGRVLVEVGFDHGAVARREEMREAGGQVLSASRAYQSATVAVAPADLGELASVPDVSSVKPVREPLVRAVDCEGGSVISEGVAQMNTEAARALPPGTKGTGVTVGVLSDSYDTATQAADGSGPVATKAADDVATADLPGAAGECVGQMTDVNVLKDFNSPEAADEGRAMMQIVHDVAPEAKLAFATAFEGEEQFANYIEQLAEPAPGGAGAQVIVDDVAYFEEPFFQEGPVANAIRTVTEGGATYLSAAGNDNLFDGEGNEIGSWEAPEFRDAGKCPPAVASLPEINGKHCLDFNPEAETDTTFGIEVEPEEVLTLDLQWAESWGGVGTDLDAFLLDSQGGLLTGSVEDNPGHTQEPVEILQWENTSSSSKVVQLVVNRYAGGSPPLKFALLQNGGGVTGTEYPSSGGGDVVGPTVFGHAGSTDAIAVGAVQYSVNPLSPTAAPETYSSRGPSTLYFEPVPGSGAAAELTEPEVLSKPDVAATDCGKTTFFAHKYASKGDFWRFCGTSAAAPHAAGVIALMKASEPLAEPDELREALVGTATPFGEYGPCAMGGGFVEALGALEALGEPITAPEPCEAPDASGPVVKAAGNWGIEEPVKSEEKQTSPPVTPTATPPQTFFAHRPAKLLWRRGAVLLSFRFRSDQSPVTFRCSVDAGSYRPCAVRISRRFAVGPHVVRVKARNAAGQTDPTPAVYRFRVKRLG